MNVMAQAHKATKARIAYLKANSLYHAPYAVIFKNQLRQAHIDAKAQREIEAHKESKVLTKPNRMTEERQKEIIQEGRDTFNAQQSTNPYKQGTHAHDLFLEGWLRAQTDFYNNQNQIVK